MRKVSQNSSQEMLADLGNDTSSQESEHGLMPSVLLESPTTVISGQARAPVNRSPSRGKGQASATQGTFGLHGLTSSPSVNLQSYLVNKLQAATDSLGSTMYTLTWKVRDTPLGRQICALRASALPTDASGCTSQRSGWISPAARDWKDSPGMSTTGTNPDGSTRNRVDQLPRQARLTDFGEGQNGYSAGTGKRGQLNPAFSRWLMGLLEGWDDCAPMGTPSSRSKQRSSSQPHSMP